MHDEFSDDYREARRAYRRRRILPTFLIFATVYFGIRGCVSLMADRFDASPQRVEPQLEAEGGPAVPE